MIHRQLLCTGLPATTLLLSVSGVAGCTPGPLASQDAGKGSAGGADAVQAPNGASGNAATDANMISDASQAPADAGRDADATSIPEDCAAGTVGSSETSQSDPFPDCEHPPVEADCDDGWCEIPAGCFVMGSPESEWGHKPYEEIQAAVTITRPFLIQQTEVTIQQWTGAGMPVPTYVPDADGYCPHAGFPCGEPCLEASCPIGGVTWFEAVEYANLLSEKHDPPLEPCYQLNNCQGDVGSGMSCSSAESTAPTIYDCEGFRLPTDAEWEYAARAGTKTAYYSGDNVAYGDQVRCGLYCNPDPNLEKIGWYCYNSGGRAHPVKQLVPNAWGLYDIVGNVYEWNNDESDGYGALTPLDPGGTIGSGTRNLRGGSYGTWAGDCRMARQSAYGWQWRFPIIGFRLVRTLQ